jgi:hypothetical protein
MPSLNEFVTVSITTATAGISQEGFGKGMILSANAAWTERTRSYSNLAAVALDFASTTPEYKQAAAYFGQTPCPPSVMIGRLANKPTQRWAVRVSSVQNSTAYKVKVGANEATFTSDANATNDEIVAGLVTAINALSGDTLTASADTSGGAGSHFVRLLADAPANWNAVKIIDTGLLKIVQDHADPGVAADLDAIKLEDNTWYAVVNSYNSTAMGLAIAAWCEANKKLFLADTQETEAATVVTGSDSTTLMKQVKNAAYEYTPVVYHRDNGSMIAAAWDGKCLPFQPGSETWAFKTLAGVEKDVLTDTQIANLKAKSGNFYVEVGGQNFTLYGTTAGTRKYIDVLRGIDWLQADMQARVVAVLVTVAKIPFTDPGIALVEAAMRASLTAGVRVGLLAATPAPTVIVPKAASVSPVNKADRLLPDMFFNATGAGAIHHVNIAGQVSF